MVVLKRERKILGREENNNGVLIPGAKVIPANQDAINKANAKLRKKCASQRINDAEAAVAAREMYAGAAIPIKNAKVIPTDPRILVQMDSESIKKSAEQQRDEVGVMGYAREMIAGPCDDEKGKTLIKKL